MSQPADLDAAVVAHAAWLARVHLLPEEAVRIQHDLARFLGHVADLQAIDTTGLEPMLHPHHAAMPLRPDVIAPSLGTPVALAHAPASDAGCFTVPRVVERS